MCDRKYNCIHYHIRISDLYSVVPKHCYPCLYQELLIESLGVAQIHQLAHTH